MVKKIFTSKNIKARVGLNTIYQVLGRVVTAITGLIITKLVIGSIGLSGFGEFMIVITYVTIFWMLTDFGLNAVVVREMTANPEKEEEYFGSLVTLRTLLSFFLAAVALIFLIWLPYGADIKWAIALGIISILTQGLKGATHGLFQTQLRYELQFFSNFAGSIFYLSLIYYFLKQELPLVWLIGAFVAGQVVMTAVSVYLSNRISRFHFNLNWPLLKRLAIITIPFGISLLFNLGNFKLDAFLLSVLDMNGYSNEDAVGIYNVAYKFFEFALIVPTFLMNAVYPVMIRSFEDQFGKFKKIFWQSTVVLLTISITGVIATFILGEWAVSIVANLDEFMPSVTVLYMLIVAAPVFFISSLFMWTVLTFKDQAILVKIYAAAFAFNLVSNLWLIPQYSFCGAAVTTGLSELLILILLGLHVWRKWRKIDLENSGDQPTTEPVYN